MQGEIDMTEPLLTQHRFQQLYEEILYKRDPGKTNRNVKSVWIKYQIAYYLQPKFIVELGVRAGYSAWALHLGCPTAKFLCYDNYAPGFQGDAGHEAAIPVHAKRLLGKLGIKLIIADTQKLKKLPIADFYHVDANHQPEPEYNDLMLCLRSNPAATIVAHDSKAAHVKMAINRARKACGFHTRCSYIDSHWGDSVISQRANPWVKKITSFNEALVKEDVCH